MVEIYTACEKGDKDMKTRKVMELNVDHKCFVCIYDEEKANHYILYEKWYDNGWHRIKIREDKCFVGVLDFLHQYAWDNAWGF